MLSVPGGGGGACLQPLLAHTCVCLALTAVPQGPFLGGHMEPTVADCALAPKLYHVMHGAPHWKQFEVGNSLAHVHNYMKVGTCCCQILPALRPALTPPTPWLQAWEALEAWREVQYPPEAIHDGWEAKVGTA